MLCRQQWQQVCVKFADYNGTSCNSKSVNESNCFHAVCNAYTQFHKICEQYVGFSAFIFDMAQTLRRSIRNKYNAACTAWSHHKFCYKSLAVRRWRQWGRRVERMAIFWTGVPRPSPFLCHSFVGVSHQQVAPLHFWQKVVKIGAWVYQKDVL
jgi:hypothetical protein